MPRAVKKETEENLEKAKTKATSNSKKSSTTKKAPKTSVAKAEATKSAEAKVVKKTTVTKAKTTKKSTTPKDEKALEGKKATAKKVTAKKETTTTKTTASKKADTKKAPVAKTATAKKAVVKKETAPKKAVVKKETETKKVTPVKKATTKKDSTTKATKATVKKTAKTKTTSSTKVKKVTKVKAVKKVKEEKKDFANIVEYYDLPYRYNETIVKILAQTPKILFVYWDVSDDDREKYKEKYGEYFFNDTYPVLIVHNKTLNYYQEIEINDFANSWYISISDPRSEYVVELGRRFKEYVSRNENQPYKEEINSVVYVTTSNNLIMPNDHVLLDEVKPRVKYRNVKTGEEFYKNTRSILANNKLIDFYELYKGIYQVEDLSGFLVLNNPGSGNPTSTFK